MTIKINGKEYNPTHEGIERALREQAGCASVDVTTTEPGSVTIRCEGGTLNDIGDVLHLVLPVGIETTGTDRAGRYRINWDPIN